MKRKVHVISIQEEFLKNISKQIIEVLGDRIEISSMTIKNLEMGIIKDGDIVILSKEILRGIARPFIPVTCSIIIAKRAINIVNTKELLLLPNGQNIEVVNDTIEHAKETAASLQNIFFEHQYFVDEGFNAIPASIDYIVTPGELQLVPYHFTNVIDIGPRVMDYDTFIKLAKLIDEEYNPQNLMNRFMKSQVSLAMEHMIDPIDIAGIQSRQFVVDEAEEKLIEIKSDVSQEDDIASISSKIEEHGFMEESLKILELYEEGKKQYKSYGRLKIKEMLDSSGFNLSEQQVRVRLEVLQELGLLHARQGRGGTIITNEGEQFLKNKKAMQGS